MQGVNIINTSHVDLPSSGEIIPLSFFDTFWMQQQQPVQTLFLFPNAALSSSSLSSFKSSLTRALSLFYPLAGKLDYQRSADQLVIDCSTLDNGVFVTEAESDLNIHQLANKDTYDIESFKKLVPYLTMEKLPVPVFAVQITSFIGGGVTVGTALNHCVMDGSGFWQFIETWGRICSKSDTRFAFGVEPNHDRKMILHPEKEEMSRGFLRRFAPDLPQLPQVTKASVQGHLPLSRHTFTIKLADIEFLKQQVKLLLSNNHMTSSSFVAIAAHFWVCLVKSRCHSNKNKDTQLRLLVDLRQHFGDNAALFTGNCVRGIHAMLSSEDLTGPNGLASAYVAIADAVKSVREEPMKGFERWQDEYENRPAGMTIVMTGSNKSREYKTDFGWGKPARVEPLSINCDGEVFMLAGGEMGSVQATVGLDKHMETFCNAFSDGLGLLRHCDCRRSAKL